MEFSTGPWVPGTGWAKPGGWWGVRGPDGSGGPGPGVTDHLPLPVCLVWVLLRGFIVLRLRLRFRLRLEPLILDRRRPYHRERQQHGRLPPVTPLLLRLVGLRVLPYVTDEEPQRLRHQLPGRVVGVRYHPLPPLALRPPVAVPHHPPVLLERL